MAYADIYNAANDEMFQGRCQVAMWKAAQDILSEDPQSDNHSQRFDWATAVLRNTARISKIQLAMQILKNSTIASSPGSASDGDIQFQANSVIDDLISIG